MFILIVPHFFGADDGWPLYQFNTEQAYLEELEPCPIQGMPRNKAILTTCPGAQSADGGGEGGSDTEDNYWLYVTDSTAFSNNSGKFSFHRINLG